MLNSNPLKRHLTKAIETSKAVFHSSRGKDIFLYLLFVFVAFIFWMLLSLDAEVTRDYEIPVQLTEMPDTVHLINNPPKFINVSVRSKGSQLMRYEWGKMPVFNVKYSDFAVRHNQLFANRTRLDNSLRNYFGPNVSVIAIKPDSIVAKYTSRKGLKVPIVIVADINTDLQYTVSGPLKANIDSATIYSINDLRGRIHDVTTNRIILSNLKDTMTVEVGIQPIEGVGITPSKVRVMIPVEPLIAKKRQVPVSVTGLPLGMSLITFPSKITISYLVPMSKYNSEQAIRAYVRYGDTSRNSSKLPVFVSEPPAGCTGLTYTPDSLEYIIEQSR